MIYSYPADLIPLLQHLIEALRPFAKANYVNLSFASYTCSRMASYHPLAILPPLCDLLCRIITFTPQDHEVKLMVPKNHDSFDEAVQIQVQNTGVSLDYLGVTITDGIDLDLSVKSLGNSGTLFDVSLPVKCEGGAIDLGNLGMSSVEKSHRILPFFKQLHTHLYSHFSSIQKIEREVSDKDQREGNFLRKVHAVILANLESETFDQLKLSQAMALSRSQLYRRLKPLVSMSPAQYIRYLRLQKSKELLQSTDLSVGEVGFRMGFINVSHFARIFKDQFGFTPSECRPNKQTRSS